LQFFPSLAALEWCIWLEILVAILDICTKNAILNFLTVFSHFCVHFDFSLIFQALKTPQNTKPTFFGDLYVNEDEMLFLNVA